MDKVTDKFGENQARSRHIVAAAREYESHGWVLVPVDRATKRPALRGWQRPENQGAIPGDWGGNIGLAHVSSGTCCLDLDMLDRARDWLLLEYGVVLDSFLEADDAVRIVSGRDNKDKLVYGLDEPLLRVVHAEEIDGKKATILEFRGVSLKGTTFQDVLPPSIHPDTGEPYRWGGKGDWRNLPPLPDELREVWLALIEARSSRDAHDEADTRPPPPQRGNDWGAEVWRDALGHVDPNCDYDTWIKVGMAIHAKGLDFELWDEWSAEGDSYPGTEALRGHWDSFEAQGGISAGTLYYLAVESGWTPPPPPRLSVDEMFADVGVEEAEDAPQSGNSGISTESDDALALAFIDRNPNLRYVEARGSWMRWDGQRWDADSTGHTFSDVRAMLRRAQPGPAKNAEASLRSAQRVAAVERLARYDRRTAATIEQWDAEDWRLNTPAGIVDLKTGKVYPHDPAAYHTKITAAGPEGECPRWEQFLMEVTNGDAALIRFLQRVVGYALSGAIREHALFFFYGTGRNGKGVFLNTLKGVFGDYATVASMETFSHSAQDRHPTDLAGLQGARLVIAQETEEGRRWAETRIKALTGGDPITARFMRQDFFTFQPKFKLLIAGNHKPRLQNVDEAMRSRLHLIPFTVTIPPEKRDPELPEKLRAEWPGIMQWCIDGCLAYLQGGLNPPKVVAEATAAYFSSQDIFGEWLETCCETGPGFSETPSSLFSSWRNFAEARNETPGKQATFNERMQNAGFSQGRDRTRGRYWRGIRVKNSPIEENRMWA